MYLPEISSLDRQGVLAWLNRRIDRAMARGSSTFKQADIVRAVKAAHAAGLAVTATQIGPDGTIRLIHTDPLAAPSSDYDRLQAEL